MASFLRRYFAGGGTTTTLASSIGASDSAFTLTANTGWPGTPGVNFGVVIDRGTGSEEKILCSQNVGNTVTVAASGRGADGTSATTHNINAPVSLCALAIDFDEANQVANLLGNAAEGSVFYGKGAGALAAKLAVGTTGQILGTNGTDPVWTTPLGLTSASSFIGGPVSLTASTPANITSLTLAAGTWLLTGQGCIDNTTAATVIAAQLWIATTSAGDRSTAITGAEMYTGGTTASTAHIVSLACSCIVAPAITTTYYLVGELAGGAGTVGSVLAADTIINLSGLVAIRVA